MFVKGQYGRQINMKLTFVDFILYLREEIIKQDTDHPSKSITTLYESVMLLGDAAHYANDSRDSRLVSLACDFESMLLDIGEGRFDPQSVSEKRILRSFGLIDPVPKNKRMLEYVKLTLPEFFLFIREKMIKLEMSSSWSRENSVNLPDICQLIQQAAEEKGDKDCAELALEFQNALKNFEQGNELVIISQERILQCVGLESSNLGNNQDE